MGTKRKHVPPRPLVEHPVSWTCAAQDIAAFARHEAHNSLMEQRGLDKIKGFAAISAMCRLDEEIEANPETRHEFYRLAEFFIARAVPCDGASRYGLPVDRAHARLRVWLQLFT